MKKLIWISLICFIPALNSFAQPGTVPVSVTRFKQEVEHIFDSCSGWSFTEQDQLRTELERELSKNGLKVLERKDIRTIYSDEFEMPNLNQKTVAKRGQFIAAKYTITGGISELGVCENSSKSGIQLGGIVSLLGGPSVDLGVKKKTATSKVKVVGQIVSVETGEIVKSFEAYSEIKDNAFGVEGGVYGIGASHESKSKPPIERATNQAIQELANKIAGYLITTSCQDCKLTAQRE
jgi:curli biogenesis system outer membrane secretion channel CsgG